jgi:hypothetical protein
LGSANAVAVGAAAVASVMRWSSYTGNEGVRRRLAAPVWFAQV